MHSKLLSQTLLLPVVVAGLCRRRSARAREMDRRKISEYSLVTVERRKQELIHEAVDC
jgi:cytidylate kinase